MFLDVTGPGGMIITGGMLPEPEQCFPCPNELDCCKRVDNQEINVSIGYITQSMQINETQELSVEGFNPKCPAESYQWEIASGGGSLSETYGYEVTYTAPGNNYKCEQNPTINLICGGIIVDTLHLAVNAYQAPFRAFAIKQGCEDAPTPTCVAGNFHCCTYLTYDCAGNYFDFINPTTGGYPCAETDKNPYLWCSTAPSVYDYRQPYHIEAGCCPGEIL